MDLRRSTRNKKIPDFYSASLTETKCIYVNAVSVDSPSSYEEVLESNEYDLCKEIDSLYKNKTWELVEKPKNAKVIDLKWIFTNKSDGRKKARLLARGFQQNEIVEDLYSPVARVQTLKLLLSYCCQKGLKIIQMDVETAFLNGRIKSDLFAKQLVGYSDNTNRVCKLKKAIYGLRESPRTWYERFDNFLRKLVFLRSENDYCLYMKHDENKTIYLILFVVDLLIFCKNKEKLNEIKNKL